mmetsp:Transcript_14130/g.13659  ORF Transcript_14130/g.13659 Transcript_14130/m.13659 type:complete len:362 (+) Transcript_14130:2195-3280(+)
MIDIKGDESKCSIICADDTIANFFNINVVNPSVTNDGLHADRMMNNRSIEIINELENICINHAVISSLVINHNKDNSLLYNNSNNEKDLLVLCRSSDDNNKNMSDPSRIYCAKVSLTSNNDCLSPLMIDKNGIEKICLYIAPTSKSSHTESSNEDDNGNDCIDNDDMNRYNNDSMTEDSGDEDEISDGNDIGDDDRIAAVIGIGKGSNNSVCLFRIDFKDLKFVDITNMMTTDVPDIIPEFDFDSRIRMEILHSLRSQRVGDNVGDCPIRQRLLQLKLPHRDDDEKVLLEASAARGVVLVGTTSTSTGCDGKVIIVDMEIDDDDDDDDDDNDEAGDDENDNEDNEDNDNDDNVDDSTHMSE